MFSQQITSGLLILIQACLVVPAVAQQSSKPGNTATTKNEVVVMGMIHGKHRQQGPYDLERLKDLIRQIKPDYILTEIPPDRLEAASKQFRDTGRITESRVRVFPEYIDAVFPLTREMNFEIIACAGWTKPMADSRRATMAKLQQTHKEQYAEVTAAQQRIGRLIARAGDANDPVLIHTDRYDALVEAGMQPYDRYFNDLIGDGGWSNINAAHYGHIADALDNHSGKGKRFLITFGSWHKNYIRKQLKKRNDVTLVPMSSFLESSHPSPSEWNQFRGNANRTGTYGSTEIAKPKVVWEYDTGDIIESSAAVVGDTVFIGGHANRLHALDRESGRLKWKFDVGGLVRASPSVANGVVYFGADDNRFYAVDAATGKKKWDFALGDGGEQSSPAILNGVVYFGGFDNHVYALDAKTGQLKWKQDVGASMLSSPFVTENSVFIGTYGGKVFALNRESGEVKWQFYKSDQPVFSSPVELDGLVYFTSYDHHVYAVKADDGDVKWKHKTDGQIFSSPVIDGDTLFVGSNDKNLYALDLKTGEPKWKTDLGGAVFSSPAVTAKSIYVGSSDGNMYALNRDGSIRWAHSVGEKINVWTSPTASQGQLYFGSHAGKVVVLGSEE
jgi:outer membrane protein assembly factor BamB